MRRTLFIVSSYYQLINAISIAIDRKGEMFSELLLVKPGMDQYIGFKKLIDMNVFVKVMDWYDEAAMFYLVSKNKREYFVNTGKKLKTLLLLRKLQKSLPNYGQKYDEICIFYPDIVTRIITAALTDRKTQIIFAEDGTFTYEFFGTSQSAFRTAVYRLWLRQDVKKECQAVYVHRPELVDSGKKKIEIRILPTELEKLKGVFSEICKQDLNYDDLIRAKVIMFDQNLEYDEVLRRQQQIADQIGSIYNKNQFVVKLHPGTDSPRYSRNLQLNQIRIPFEVPMASMEDLESKVLVSIFSTTCMNPKFLLNAEPIVIFTYKLAGLEKLDFFDKKYLDILDKLKKLYRRKERILIPDTNEELDEMLFKIKNGEFE